MRYVKKNVLLSVERNVPKIENTGFVYFSLEFFSSRINRSGRQPKILQRVGKVKNNHYGLECPHKNEMR